MADFNTHVTVSSVLGAGYSVAGMVAGMSPETALVAGGLCGVAGMLPDVDSDSGIPRRESMGFAAAIVPMLLVDRFKEMQLEHDEMVLAAAGIYFFIRFAAARLIGRWSVHRGMWHSIPAVLIFAGLAFLIVGPADNLTVRYFKAFAVGLGAMSHLVLDEIYSVDTRGIVPKFKKSFGTAIKFWGKNAWANFSTYAKLAVVVMMIAAEPLVLERLAAQNPALADRVRGYSERLPFYAPSGQATTQPNQPFRNQPLPNQPAIQQPPSPALPVAQPSFAPPTGSQQGYAQPQQQRYQEPTYQQPTYQQPTYPQPTYQPPVYQQQQPPGQQPTSQQPGYAAPARPFSAQAPVSAPSIRRQ